MLRAALPDSRRWQLLLAAASLVLVWVMVRSAWLSDDGLITFRTIEHFVSGEGLRFNLAERVQSYTHPLWLFLLTPVYLVTGEAFYTPILVSLIVSFAAVVCLVMDPVREGRPLAAIAALGCLVSSKAFVDYTSSGLETPLSYLLAALALRFGLSGTAAPERRFFALALVTSLAFVNRIDSVLLLAPILLLSGVRGARGGTPVRSWLGPVLLATAPALCWLAFATFYYGSPLPNTFYAKLATGIDPALLREQGLFYLGHSFRFDVVTPIVILLSLGLAAVDAFRRRSYEAAALAAGIVVHLAYVVEIGGDFMAVRFLALPLFVAVGLLARVSWPAPAFAGLAFVCLALSLASPLSPLRAGPDYENRDEARVLADRGISDERGFYYQRRGLLARDPERELVAGSACREEDAPRVEIRSVCGELGYEGFAACPETFLADRCALSDPLLARMPMIDATQWRVGHYFRRVPRGYRDSLEQDENLLVDPRHRALYDDIRLATRAPLFAEGRLGAIWRLNVYPRR